MKTAAARFVQERGLEAAAPSANLDPADPAPVILDLCASYRRAIVETLAERTFRAAHEIGARSVCVSGGVACNLELRRRFAERAAGGEAGLSVHFPPPALSTDNAAMIAAAGYPKLVAGQFADFSLNADVHLKLHQ